MLKICKICKQEKDIKLFRKAKGCKDGYSHTCLECVNVRVYKWKKNTNYKAKRATKRRDPKTQKIVSIQERKEWLAKNKQDIIDEMLGKEFGDFKIVKYIGYKKQSKNDEHKRHLFIKECIYCKRQHVISSGHWKALLKNGKGKCNICRASIKVKSNHKGSINFATNERKCKKCERWLPATEVYFNKHKGKPFGLHYYCRNCTIKRGGEWRKSEKGIKANRAYNKIRQKDPIIRLKCRTAVLIKNTIKYFVENTGGKFKKKSKTEDILGCSKDDFVKMIERQLSPEMTLSNYGKVWNFEHIVSISCAETEDEVYSLNHHINFKPLNPYVNQHIVKENIVGEWLTPRLKKKYKDILEKNKDKIISLADIQWKIDRYFKSREQCKISDLTTEGNK